MQNSLGLLRILRQFKPHLVHAHMRNGLALVLPWARLLRIPVIMHLHNIHDQSYGLMRWPQRIIAVSTAVQAELLNQGVPKPIEFGSYSMERWALNVVRPRSLRQI